MSVEPNAVEPSEAQLEINQIPADPETHEEKQCFKILRLSDYLLCSVLLFFLQQYLI